MNLKHKSIQKLNSMSKLIFKRSGHWRKLMTKGALIPLPGTTRIKRHQVIDLRAVYTAMAATIAQGAKAWNQSASSSSPSDSSAPLSPTEQSNETPQSKPVEPSTTPQD